MARAVGKTITRGARRTSAPVARPPAFVEPQLAKLVETAPTGPQWVHEIKYDGFRMAARIEGGRVRLLTRSGLDWMAKYPATAASLSKLPVDSAYIDGELCAVRDDGVTSFAKMQSASDSGAGALVFYAFDLLFLDGQSLVGEPLSTRKAALAKVLKRAPPSIVLSEHLEGDGERIRAEACKRGLEGLISKRIDQKYLPGNRRVWVKSKCLGRAEFVVVGWTDPEGSRPHLGALLLGYYTPEGTLTYAGRVGTGMPVATLKMLRDKLDPLSTSKMPLAAPPPRKTRFGSPLALSRVHWVKPKLVAEITYLTWTDDGLLRHTVFVGLREDKPAAEVRREIPSP